MRMPHHSRCRAGFTQLELWIVVAIVAIVGLAVLLPALAAASKKAKRVSCNGRLKQIGLASRIYASDHGELYPQQVTTNKGGTLEYVGRGQSWRHYLAMSNQLVTPFVLTCPADSLRATSDWQRFGSNNLSFFISLDASENNGQAILSGDRDIETETPATNGILALVTNRTARWTGQIHYGSGNIGLADGSVQQFSTPALQAQVNANRDATNRIELP